MKRRGRKARKPKTANPTASADVSDVSRDNSPASYHAPQARTRRHPSKTPFKRDSASDFSEDDLDDKVDQFANPMNQDFRSQCPRHQDMIEEHETMRTLYSHFPDERLQLLSHILSIIALHILIFPLVNCIWSYHLAYQEDLMAIVNYVTFYPKASFKEHLFEFDWISLPSFNAESISFALAVAVRDRLTKSWNRAVFDFIRVARNTLCKMTRRYRN